ncbi:LysR substrate-binding domain-containing protein [Paenibacillus glycanilyticus]|uniref:LysR family transcriptional regulator n=1 Tax=Paenibacillus glycanilyticus TaxID=126569 RepID=UPI00203FA2C9|nr:LysR substrate-binding domain-containing protein [Paenibacillus glycanilyticus]MCM3630189.1 LysR substrate-binding domain-containing protein [Paenibacillus glycanilyticus]
MSLDKYRIFSKVVEVGSLTKAGELLSLTQSAISHAISSLELEFGLSLLIRNRSGIRLTNNGEHLIPHIREILRVNEQLNQEIAAIKGIEAGMVKIGTFSSISIQWLPQIMKKFQNLHPQIDLKLLDGNYYEIEEWIASGAADFGFVNLPSVEGFGVIPLHQDRMMCVLSSEHPLCHQQAIRLEQVKAEPFIMPVAGCDTDINRIFTANKLKPNIKFELEDDHAIIAMVQSNLGISILPEMILSQLPGNVITRPLEGEYYRSIGIAAASFKTVSPAAKKLMAFIEEWFAQSVGRIPQ